MRRRTLRKISTRLVRPSVERVEARILLASFTVTNASDNTSMGSLRFAIGQSNATPGSNTINFDIASSGVQTIDLLSALPATTVPVTIDGTTEIGYSGTPLIVLDGAGAGTTVDGLDIQAGFSTVKGLAINQFTGEGISLSLAGNDLIENDFLGTDSTGTVAEGNAKDGLLVLANSNSNTITGNVISGNTNNGIYLNGTILGGTNPATSKNLITGNLIGTDVTGTLTLGNNHDGIYVQNAPMTTVGGTTMDTRNIISGNGTGMELYNNSDNSLFEGNYIGTDITGEVALGNNLSGGFFEDNVVLRGISNSTIGGTATGAGNLISGGSHYGIDSFVIGSSNITIQGNLIGTDALGKRPLGNASGGLVIGGPTAVTIGGTAAGAANVISSNGGNGINTTSSMVVIQGNLIGTDITGTQALGNKGNGIDVGSGTGVTIGGTATGAGNVISNNTANGLVVSQPAVVIEGNKIGTDITGTVAFGNTSDGIRIGTVNGLTVGGTASGAGNLISANGSYGIDTSFDGNNATNLLIEGNLVGTDITGILPLGNLGGGMDLADAINVTVGGTAVGAGNVVSANGTSISASVRAGSGILIANIGVPSNFLIQGNKIGTDITGTKALGNLSYGLYDGAGMNVTVGGTVAGEGNVISSNLGGGIFAGDDWLIEGNLIGTDITGTMPLGNGEDGILAIGANDTIGGLAIGAGNIIAYNGTSQDISQPSGISSSNDPQLILSNSIHDNFYFGIKRNFVSGPLPATPSLISATTSATGSTITGTLTDDSGTYTLQFFSTPDLNLSGNAEGETLIGSENVTITGTSTDFTETFATPFTPGDYITATSTKLGDDTSVFSPQIVGTQPPVLPTFGVQASESSVAIGQQVTDIFTITNSAMLANDSGLIFTDAIPAGTTFISGLTSTGIPVLVTNGVASADIGELDAGQTVTVTIILSPKLAAGTSFTNVGDLTATVPPITSGTLTASVTTDVLPTADLSVSITGPTGPALIGQALVYTVTATNMGPSTASGIILTDTLPGAVFYESSLSSSGQTPTESGGVVTDSIPSLASGASEVLTIIVIPTGMAVPAVSDSALVMANEFDPNPVDNSFTLVTAVNPVADLAIVSETATPNTVAAGSMVTFVINVANDGPSVANGVTVLDVLPAGLVFLTGTADGGSLSDVGGVISAPIGTLLFGGTSIVTIIAFASTAGTFTNISSISSIVADSNMMNNVGIATVEVTPVADLSVALIAPAGPVYNNAILTYAAIVTNAGPSPATNVLFADPLFPGAMFVAIEANMVLGSVNNGVAEVSLGTIAPGASVLVVLMVIPIEPGIVTDTAVVAGTEPDPNMANNMASGSTAVIVPQSIITFASSGYAIPENGGFAAITLNRDGYDGDDVTVHFSTFGGNATAGVDYLPVSETVDFPAGSTSATVLVPVLENPHDNHNEYVGLEIDSATGTGLLVPGATTALLTIIDINPVLVGPTVTAVKLSGYVSSIVSIEIDTTGGLDPSTANNPLNYSITALGGTVKQGLPLGTNIPVVSAIYDPTTGAVTLVPAQSLPGNELFLVNVNGSRPGAVTDLAGNPLNSIVGVKLGSDYNLTVARGTDIVYPNENGDPVTLKLTGPGTIDIDRYVAGDLEILQVVGGVAHKTVVTGTVHPTLQRSKIGTILGIGQFGSIQLKMTTPPFYVSNTVYPNLNQQVDAPAIDTLLPTPTVPPSPKSRSKIVKASKPTHAESLKATVHEASVHVAKAHPAKTQRHR